MRLLTSTVVAAAGVLFLAGTAGPAARAGRPSPNSISFWDARHGLLGTGPTSCGPCGSGTIQTTDDGGRTWRVRYRTRDRITNISAAGSVDAWAVVEHCRIDTSCRPTVLIRSTDRGRTWTSVSRSRIVAVSFATAVAGLGIRGTSSGCCTYGAPVRTRDGGRTWTPLGNPCRRLRSTGDLQAVALVSPMRGWALCVGQPGVGNQAKAIFETSNGGRGWRLRAWASIFARGRGGLGTGGYPQGIAFGRAGRGLLWESRGALFLTKDGGRNWRVAGLTRYDVDFGQSASVAANDRYYVLLQTNGRFRLVTTHDSGAHWHTVHRWG